MIYNTSFSMGLAFVIDKNSKFQDLHTPFEFEVGVGGEQTPLGGTGRSSRTCTHEA